MLSLCLKNIINPILRSVIYADDAAYIYAYALKSNSYDYAELTNEVTVQHKEIVSFSFVISTDNEKTNYLLKGSTGAYVYYRSSDGRFRLYSDQGNFYTIIIPNLNNGATNNILLTLDDEGMQVYLNGSFFGTALRRDNEDTFSVSQIGSDATTFGVTLANKSSYPMLTYDTSSVNFSDMIGSNDLTYVGLVNLTDEDYEKVKVYD